ncbi:MAG: glycogen debranching protein GlgX [Rhizobiaceae bacterium]|nr:glycogen debranching protein GlgX [Rhizobiaceae bacterium]MCV0405563.1 glycogen debranching protein GlgX [Rhizobiaceae bacterium]
MDEIGAVSTGEGTRFTMRSASAERIWACVFDTAGEREIARHELERSGDVFSATISGIGEGTRYGLRADGPYDPANGLWFDPDKLLVDPWAVEIDRPYAHDPRLAARRGEGGDTAGLVPKAVVRARLPEVAERAVRFRPGGLIYELSVRAFTMRHPDIPAGIRGTIAALAHPVVIAHLKKLGVSAVELMPMTAWIDERHLPPLGLSNAWGYNPVTFMALDPKLAPGGVSELRETVAALRAEGIGVILDLVFNHTGESDALGPTLSLRGLDARAYYRHGPDGRLVNDTGTGNTTACDEPAMRELVLGALRHFVLRAGVDGFRFDLAPVLGRTAEGFDPNAELLARMSDDPVLADRVLIAEPWDIGPGGYQLGNFPERFLEWNDRSRDDMRRFWRGDAGMAGRLATRLAGSSDVFGGDGAARTRTVNFFAAHDGMTLADLVAYETRHNHANGEDNRDGHEENLSWNNGVEGETDDVAILAARRRDCRALLATLFASRGTIMLTAGDEFGRSQHGNNNAYAQDNAITWLDWAGRDREMEDFVARLSALRGRYAVLRRTEFLTGGGEPPDVEWRGFDGKALTVADWEEPETRRLVMVLSGGDGRLAVAVNGSGEAAAADLPGDGWRNLLRDRHDMIVPARSVGFFATY